MIQIVVRLLSLIPDGIQATVRLGARESCPCAQQLVILQRSHRRPRLGRSDRIFWLLLSRYVARSLIRSPSGGSRRRRETARRRGTRRWRVTDRGRKVIGFIRQEFMMIIGPISSIYDFLTFGVLLCGLPRFHERAAIPHLMVRGISGDTNAGGICDPDGREPVQEPCRPPVVDRRVGGRCYRRCAAVHTGPEPAGIYAAAVVALGCDCRIGSRLPSGGASRQVLVLSTTCAALSHPNHHLPEATVTGTATMTRGKRNV
jgi:hypothetical protein